MSSCPVVPTEPAAPALVLLTPAQLLELVRSAVRAELSASAPTSDELLDVAAVSGELGVSERHVRRMIANRELHAVRIGRRVLIPRGEIQRLARAA